MTDRKVLNEGPYNGIQVGEKVLFLSTSQGNTRIHYGFYRGTYQFIPVVEYFYRKREFSYNRYTGKWIPKENEDAAKSRRVFLKNGRLFSFEKIKKFFDEVPNLENIEKILLFKE